MSSISPLLFIVSGPSGSGKRTVMQHVGKAFPSLRRVPTYTTREPRTNEVAGVDYNFISEELFLEKLANGDIFECSRNHGAYYYGSPSILLKSDDSTPLIVEMDYKGMFRLRASSQRRVVSLFLVPPLGRELQQRIELRSEVDNLEARLNNGLHEMQFAWAYDYVLINEELNRFLADAEHAVGGEVVKQAGLQMLLDRRHEYDHTLVK